MYPFQIHPFQKPEGFFERYPNTYQVDFEISKKNLHPSHAPYGGMFLEVKNPKNPNPKVVLHPNTIFKSHHFVVQFLIHLYIHSSRQTIGPRDTSIRDITKKWWFLKENFGWKSPFGFRFLKIFTSKNMPPTWTFHGCKNFFTLNHIVSLQVHSLTTHITHNNKREERREVSITNERRVRGNCGEIVENSQDISRRWYILKVIQTNPPLLSHEK